MPPMWASNAEILTCCHLNKTQQSKITLKYISFSNKKNKVPGQSLGLHFKAKAKNETSFSKNS